MQLQKNKVQNNNVTNCIGGPKASYHEQCLVK